MRNLLLLSLFTTLALAGCFGADEPVQADLLDFTADAPANLALAENEAPAKQWMTAYQLMENPGAAKPSAFSSSEAVTPRAAVGAIYWDAETQSKLLMAFELHFKNSNEASRFLEVDEVCEPATAWRTYLLDGATVVIVVTDTEEDPAMLAALDEMVTSIEARTGVGSYC